MKAEMLLGDGLTIDVHKQSLMDLICGVDRDHRLLQGDKERGAEYAMFHQALNKLAHAIQGTQTIEDLRLLIHGMIVGQYRPVMAPVEVCTKIIHDGEYIATIGHNTNVFCTMLKAMVMKLVDDRCQALSQATGTRDWVVITRLGALRERVKDLRYPWHFVILKRHLIDAFKLGDQFREEFDACQTIAQLSRLIVNRVQYSEPN